MNLNPSKDDVKYSDCPISEESSFSRPFRFKTKCVAEDIEKSSLHRKRYHQGSSHRRRKRRKASHDANNIASHSDTFSDLPSESAFRESLFDALGDDEGAAFWEGVYGQPIHNYPNIYQDEQTGELERMNDDEYAQFVRRKMWEKSWEGVEAAKEEKRREREREKTKLRVEEEKRTRADKTSYDDSVFDAEIERSLQRGEYRKSRKRWQSLWRDYLHRWADLQELSQAHKQGSVDQQQLFLHNKIAWPIESGKRKDLDPSEIERFFTQATKHVDEELDPETFLSAVLKAERVRWHPDRMHHKYGFMEIDEGTTKGITAVFQAIDRMWNERKNQQ